MTDEARIAAGDEAEEISRDFANLTERIGRFRDCVGPIDDTPHPRLIGEFFSTAGMMLGPLERAAYAVAESMEC